jgi:TonB family protein
MSATESWVLGYLLNSLWQVPLIFAAAWLLARLVRGIASGMEHRVWVGALLLEVTVPACNLHPVELLREISRLVPWSWGGNSAADHVRVAMGPAAASGSGVLRLSSELLAGLALFYACTLLYFVGRFGWAFWNTKTIQRLAKCGVLTNEMERSWNRYSRAFSIDAPQLATSSGVSGPVTVGIRRGMLLVPPNFLDSVCMGDLDAMFAHEFAHMRRHDFAKNLLYELLSLPVAYHPLLRMTRSRVAESREMVCDAMAADVVAGRESYARSLLRLASRIASPTPVRTLHAIGIFDANIFERRVMSLTRSYIEIRGVRRFAIAATCVAVASITCGTALALRMEVATPAASSAAQAESPSPLRVKAEIMAGQRIGGMNPVYPPQAKADKIEGAVVLALTINENGEPVDVHVKKGVRDDLDESALTAVRQWRWKPFLLNGNPTAVKTTVTVNYSIGH